MKAASFRKLRIWQEAIALATDVFRLTSNFPKQEIFGLTSQVRRSANSVPANIAEGTGRATTKDYLHYLHVARGSAKETVSHLLLVQALKFADDQRIVGLVSRYEGLDAGICACIKNLQAWQSGPKT